MDWTIEFLYALVITTLTGSIMTLAWYLIGRLLEYAGVTNILYDLLKVVLVFYYVPAGYLVLRLKLAFSDYWEAYIFIKTPLILYISYGITALWLAGVIWGVVRCVIGIRKLHNRCADAIPCPLEVQEQFAAVCAEMHISAKRVGIVRSYRVLVPQISGLLRPKVMLPVEDYSEEELRVILIHELTHYKEHDIWLKQLAAIAGILHFFNPVVRILMRLIQRWSEYSCDFHASRRVGSSREYFSAILMIAAGDAYQNYFSPQLTEGKNELTERIERMVKNQHVKPYTRLRAVTAMVLALVLSTGSIYGATLSAMELYESVYAGTETAVEEVMPAVPEPVEVREKLSPAEAVTFAAMPKADVEPNEDGSYGFNWNVKAHGVALTKNFKAYKGGCIAVTVLINPNNVTVQVGIIEPDGFKRYVKITGYGSHLFYLNSTGSYNVIIENKTDTPVNVIGSYLIRDSY